MVSVGSPLAAYITVLLLQLPAVAHRLRLVWVAPASRYLRVCRILRRLRLLLRLLLSAA